MKLFLVLFYPVSCCSRLIYLHSNQSKKAGKPTGYRTNLNERNVHTKYLYRKIVMSILLQICVKVIQDFECITKYVKWETIGKHVTILN